MARWLGAGHRYKWTIVNLKLRLSDSYLPRGVTPDLADREVSPREDRSMPAPIVRNTEVGISSTQGGLPSRSAYRN